MQDLAEIKKSILDHADPQIEFITLFGSRARGDAGPSSDTDIAIKTSIRSELERAKLRIELSSILNGPKIEVDIVTVEDVDWEFKYRIIRDGIVLLNRNDSWQDFVESVIKYYPDYHIFFSRILDQSVRRGSK